MSEAPIFAVKPLPGDGSDYGFHWHVDDPHAESDKKWAKIQSGELLWQHSDRLASVYFLIDSPSAQPLEIVVGSHLHRREIHRECNSSATFGDLGLRDINDACLRDYVRRNPPPRPGVYHTAPLSETRLSIIRPVFESGDILIFDGDTLHRSWRQHIARSAMSARMSPMVTNKPSWSGALFMPPVHPMDDSLKAYWRNLPWIDRLHAKSFCNALLLNESCRLGQPLRVKDACVCNQCGANAAALLTNDKVVKGDLKGSYGYKLKTVDIDVSSESGFTDERIIPWPAGQTCPPNSALGR